MRKVNTKLVAILLVAIAVLGYGLIVKAGSLEPAGPPAPTMKTLDEVEPRIPIPGSASAIGSFEISSPGSYYLTGDRMCNGTGLNVNADNVTIDLMGYQLIGPGITSGTNYGIYMNMHSNVEIRNGTIRNFGSHGIYETNDSDDGSFHRTINIKALINGGIGINLVAGGSLIKDCFAKGNSNGGIAAADLGEGRGSSTIIHSTSVRNIGNGIFAGPGSTIIGCTSNGNQGDGIVTAAECTIKDCTARMNRGSGIVADVGNVIKVCTVGSNGYYTTGDVYGIKAGNGSTVTGNTVHDNGHGSAGVDVFGISIGDNSTLSGNTASYNGTLVSNSNYNIYGIKVGNGCTVIGNTANYNGTSIDGGGGDTGKIYGINSGMDCIVTDNTVHANGASTSSYVDIYGISAGDGNTVRGNTASKNGNMASAASIRGIGIGMGCTVIGNTAFQNGQGTMGIGISLGNDNFVDQNAAVGNFGTNMNTPASGLVTSDNYAP